MSRVALLVALGLIAGCKEEALNEQQLMPKTTPPPASIPKDLHIPVEVDGKPAGAIDGRLLESTKPDFEDREHQAWKIISLVRLDPGRAVRTITVVSEKELGVNMPSPKSDADLQPVLTLIRRGQISAALLSPSDPFPPFHGKGRRLNRGPDALLRVAMPVLKVVVVTATASAR